MKISDFIKIEKPIIIKCSKDPKMIDGEILKYSYTSKIYKF